MTIEDIKKEIAQLGPVHPGVLTKQLIKCGKSNCRCVNGGDDRHGPYHQLSWTISGKSGTRHIKTEEIPEIKERIKNYKKLQSLLTELFKTSINIYSVTNKKE